MRKTNIKSKKAQVSWVMILGIAAIVIFGAGLGLNAYKSKLPELRYGTFSEIGNSVDNCIRNALFYSSYYLTTRGGYLNPTNSLQTPFGNISYAMKNNTKTFVGIEVLKTEISIIANELIHICALDVFQKFPQYEITAKRPLTEIIFTRNSIEAVVDYKILAKQEQKQKQFEKFTESVPIRLSYIHSEINSMLENAIINNTIDLSYINEMDFNIRILPYQENKLFILTDKESKVNNLDFPFLFVVK